MEQHKIGTLLAMGLPMGLQYSITAIGSMVMQSANNSLGSVYVSGFTAGSRIKQFAMCPFDAIATAVSTFCGQNLGAGKYDRIKQGIRQGTAVGIAYGVFIGLVLIFFGRTLSLLFISGTEAAVLDASAKYLRCMGYFFWALGILNVFRMSTQGLGYSGRAVYGGAMEMVARITVSVLLVPRYGYTAICFADQSAWIAACLYIVPTCISCLKKVQKTIGM
jgi:Na+-driven multidrug efflux pump